MTAISFFHLPIELQDDVLKKMNIRTFSRMRQTCTSLADRTTAKRKSYPIRFKIDAFIMECKKWYMVNTKVIPEREGWRIYFPKKPAEMIGMAVKEMSVVLSDKKHPAVFREFCVTLGNLSISCENLSISFARNCTLPGILNCFKDCKSVSIDNCNSSDPYYTDILLHPVLQNCKNLHMLYTDPNLNLLPKSLSSAIFESAHPSSAASVPLFIKNSTEGKHSFRKITLIYTNGFLGRNRLHEFVETIRNKVPLLDVWDGPMDPTDDFQDSETFFWPKLYYRIQGQGSKIIGLILSLTSIQITQHDNYDTYLAYVEMSRQRNFLC